LRENDHIAVNTLGNNGKTLAYAIPGLELVMNALRVEGKTKNPGFRLLIVTNTRERALQITDQIQKLASQLDKKIQVRACTGGTSTDNEINFLDTYQPEVVVATIGRLSVHMKNSNYFNNVKLVVVDNAHKLDGYTEQLQKIFSQLPKRRKTISLTVNSDIVQNHSSIVPIIFPNAAPQTQINCEERELGSLDNVKFVCYISEMIVIILTII
jgi:superfamily II DNA/RNA helicase